MAHIAPTILEFKARFPGRFDDLTDAQIELGLTRAARMVDESWHEDDFAEGRMLYAAAFLTAQGLGVVSQGDTAALAGLASFKSGALAMEFRNGAAGVSGGDPALATSYGRQFVALRYQNRGGPRVAGRTATSYCG